ncbi:Xylosidase/arabinosidase [Microbacterium hydrocarbonoxydans]|uniref:Xylosidase/arabinosidase n=1 Tax=Microbacterium hydrocarbonoxydans TaxID=273678 RepID=A0A0M2HW73_9MICO|nr:family 43 glycosylhydrolase [Microbacterium hydrocarbonoxydans]KJL48698.1 Xylosidase/arabinosidase [Microbacterium hydrocarbonoxydans]
MLLHARISRTTSALLVAAISAAGLCLASPAVAESGEPEPQIIAAYDFEDGTARDTSGHGNDLTLAGGAAVETYGDKPTGSKALSTRGGTQHAAFPVGMFDGRDEFTISMNYKNRSSTGNFFTFAVGQDSNRYLFLRTRYQDLYAGITKASWQQESGASATLDGSMQGVWGNVTLTVSPTEIVVYYNGRPVATNSDVKTSMSELGTNLTAYLGRSLYAADPYFNGAFDDITIWDRALDRADLLGSGVVEAVDTEQILTQRVSTEAGTSILDITLDHWAPGGGATGELSDVSDVRFDFLTHSGETLTAADGGPASEISDYRDPVRLTLTKADGSTVPYEVRVHTLVTPIRIPGQADATGAMGMKFFADPEIFADGGKYYIYPTTDGYSEWGGWTIHAFESTDLVTWTDKGVVVNLRDQDLDGAPDSSILPNRTKKAWAPAMALRDGKYYLYFSGDGQTNVAVSDRPDGGFRLTDSVVADSIDPATFRDPQTGKWYIAWGQSGINYAELNDDMRSYDPATRVQQSITGYREGSYITAREYLGSWTYYYTYSVDDTNSPDYRVAYATATSMAGPWTYRGEILNKDVAKGILGTAHHSVLQVPGTDDWYVAYHAFLTDEMRPRLVDLTNGKQIATGNKRETRVARLTYTQPTAAEIATGAVPLIQRIPVTYEGVLPETTPTVSLAGDPVVGSTLTAGFGEGWAATSWSWLRDGEPLAGAAGAQYTVTAADAGHAISARGIGESATGVRNNDGSAPARTNPLTTTAAAIPGATVDVRLSVQVRCVAGKATIVATVGNETGQAADAVVTSGFGAKTITALADGRSASASFSTRSAAIAAGTVTVAVAEASVEQAYEARSCQ